MAVIVVPRDSSMQIRLVSGTNPLTGAPIIETKTFGAVKATAIDQNTYDVATALIGLQKYPVDEIRAQKESQLTE
jgi:methionine synthase I (cobalamin-dependent)